MHAVQEPLLSIVIPTHGRPAILFRCLQHTTGQTISDRLEVVVIHDGPGSQTKRMIDARSWPIPVSYEEIPKAQQGAARNRGAQKARAPLILFIGDDIFLAPDACEKHLKAHEKNKHIAVLGFTTWDSALPITPTMRWLEKTGWQFGYPKIARFSNTFLPGHLQHRFTYTSHISLPTELARAHPFREDVTLYGWEDIEWGVRLAQSGIRLFYAPDAKAYHHHHVTLEQSLRRMETLGQSVACLSRTAEHFDRMPHGWKLCVYRLFSLFPTLRGRHAKAFLDGMQKKGGCIGSETSCTP